MSSLGARDALPVVDLFAGAGGLSLGLGGAGLIPVAAAEMDTDALATYTKAHYLFHGTPIEIFEGDISNHSFRHLRGQVAAVVGGPPCQPYSLGGLRLGVLDERDGLPQFLRVLEELQPDACLIENVPGLATGKQGNRFLALINELQALKYHVSWSILHAANYGVSQRRQRLFVVGSRRPGFEFPECTHGLRKKRAWVRAGELLDFRKPLGEPNPSKVTYAKRPDLRPSPWDGHLWNGGGRPINPDGLVPTLLASMGGNKTPWFDGGGIVPEYHAHLLRGGRPRAGTVEGARRITVEEAALVQTFPIDMPWAGRRSSRYRQVGNAVPVRLAEAVGHSLHAHLEGRIRGVSNRVGVA